MLLLLFSNFERKVLRRSEIQLFKTYDSPSELLQNACGPHMRSAKYIGCGCIRYAPPNIWLCSSICKTRTITAFWNYLCFRPFLMVGISQIVYNKHENVIHDRVGVWFILHIDRKTWDSHSLVSGQGFMSVALAGS